MGGSIPPIATKFIIMEYELVEESSVKKFKSRIEELIRLGYLPQGGVCAVMGEDKDSAFGDYFTVYMQAMVRETT